MYFSIIIVSYNTKELTANCLASVFAHCRTDDFEIIVVDNNSHDGSVETLKKRFGDRIKIIANDDNRGFGAANNQGAKIARGDFLFFLNSDTTIKDDILNPLKEFFHKNREAGIVAPKLLLADGSEQPFACGKFPRLWESIIGKLVSAGENEASGYDSFATDWVSGAALVIRRRIFERIGGFDENFFMYFEDMDLCRQTKGGGYGIYVYPAAAVNHLVGRSSSGLKMTKKQYYRSQNYFFRKNYGYLVSLAMRTARFPYKYWRLYFSRGARKTIN